MTRLGTSCVVSIKCYIKLMSKKTLISAGVIIGSIIGGYLPLLFGAGLLSYSSVLFSGVGGILGIWVGYKLGD